MHHFQTGYSWRPALSRGLAALALGSCLVIGASAAPAAPETPAINQRFAHHIENHLNELGARLEITASQEQAWQGFRGAFIEFMAPSRPASVHADHTPLDAAELARLHADRAEDRAHKLSKLADATARLQQVLGPDQRLVLNESAHRFVHHEGPQGGPDGCEGHDGPPRGGPHMDGHPGMPGGDGHGYPPPNPHE